MTAPQPGWYADPYAAAGSGSLRWWDGTTWTRDVRRREPARAGAGAPAAVTSYDSVQPAEGASWDSIPQPGTTYTADALNFPPPRLRVLPLAVVVLAVIALIAFATRGG